MRTLVISDLHIGQTGGVSVLTRPRPLEILLRTLANYDRLVLLGDTVELEESTRRTSFPIAEPILRSVGEALGRDGEILLVPGNHDHVLVRDWARAQGRSLAREAQVPADASPLLAEVVSWLGADRVQVRYPGVWLADRVWATHGHYLNHYLRPVSSVGLLHPRHRRRPAEPLVPAEYEYIADSRATRRILSGLPPARWHDHALPERLAPVMGRVLDLQMRRHSLPAMAQAAHALGVDADYVIFGHVHRLGPRATDQQSQWHGADGTRRLINTGSWRFEPVVSHGPWATRDYWPGGAVAIHEDGVPRPLELLADLDESIFT
jgi:UDP-2,3-diacylglucosamine pyrophosphatase LpxH